MKRVNRVKNYNRFIYLLFCIVLILVGKSFLGESIKYPFSFVFNPVYVSASDIGGTVSELL